MTEKLKIFATTVEDTARAQIDEMNECEAYRDCTVRIMPDCHAGKGCTIGTVIEVKDRIVPNTVGVDIGCLDCDTEVLTPNGWIRIADYHRQEIMQYDPQSDSGTFCKPIAYIKNKCDKFFYFKNSKGLDQMVSEEHKMLVYRGYNGSHRYQNENPSFFVGRKGVEKGYYRFKSCFNVVSEGIRMSEELIRIDVMVQADGRLKEYVDYNFVELHFKKQRKIKRSMELLEKANIGYRHYKQSDGTTVVSFRAPKCIDKNLKKYYNASYEQLAVVAEECLYWDGHIGYRSFYSSTNKDNADVIQYAFTATNNRAAIYCHNENKKGWSDCYNVIKTRNKFVGYNVEPQIISSKDGYKYCFTTLTGYFICRRNGHVFITGNCGMMVCEIMDKDIDLERLDKVVNEKVPSGFCIHHEKVTDMAQVGMLRCISAIDDDMAQEYMGSVIIPPHIPMPEPQVKPRRDFDKEPYTMDEVVRRLSPHGDRGGEWYCTSRQPKLAWRLDMVDAEGLIVRKLVHDMREHTISKAPEIYKPETVEQLAKKIIDYNFRFLADFDRKEWD